MISSTKAKRDSLVKVAQVLLSQRITWDVLQLRVLKAAFRLLALHMKTVKNLMGPPA